MEPKKARTAETFGYLWHASGAAPHGGVHSAKTLAALAVSLPAGVVLDAGCGDGSDVAALASQGAEVIGVEISEGGTRAAFERTKNARHAHVVRADVCRLPFRSDYFAFVYSYGVLHHVPVPLRGLSELARVSRAGAQAAVYLYEDFSERAAVLRWSLRAANVWRGLTTRLPPAVLYALCVAAAPVVYGCFVVPYRVLHAMPVTRSLANALPFRHGRHPFDLTGDLYDRFSAPVEFRYSRRSATELAHDAGFALEQIRQERGWMLRLIRRP